MYRYLFEETCFERSFAINKKIDLEIIRKLREILAKNLEVEYEDVKLNKFIKTKESVEARYEVEKEISKNFVFRVILDISENENTIISLQTKISRVAPIHIVGFNYVEEIIYNIIDEFSKKSFYRDLIAEMKLKYEEISKKIYEDLEKLFIF